MLSSVGIFAAAEPESLRRLAAATQPVGVTAGTEVVREGRLPKHFYVVASGVLEVFSTGEGGHAPTKVASLQEGDHFGEIGLLEGMPATATVRAKSDCLLHRIPAADFLAAVGSSPRLSSALLERVAGGLAKTHPSYAPASGGAETGGAEALLQDVAQLADIVGPGLRPPGEAALLKAITSTALNLFDAAACSLALLRPDGSLEFAAASGQGAADVTGRTVPPGAGIAGAALASAATLIIDDVERDHRFARAFAGTTGYRPRHIAARRLESPRAIVGVMEVLDASAFRDAPDRASTSLDLFARLAATAIDSGRAFSEFGVSLLAAAAAAARGTSLGAALEATTPRGPDAGAERLAALAHRIMRLDPGSRERAIEAVSRLLDDGDPPGS